MEENNSKEINLLDLIRMFFNWLKNLGWGILRLLGNSLRLLYRNMILSCVVIVLALLVGWYMGGSSRRIYKAEGLAILNGSIAQTVKDVSRQLELSSPLADFTGLSAKLSLPDSVVKNLRGIESFYVIDFLNDSTPDAIDFKGKHPWSDTLNVRMPDHLYFRIKTKKVSQVPEVEKAFLNYFNTNERLVAEHQAGKNGLQREIQLVTSEIQRLDSMASTSYFRWPEQQAQLSRNTLLVGEQEKQLFYDDFIYLQKYKMKLDQRFANYSAPVVIPTGLVVNPVPVHGRFFYLAVWGLAGVVVTLLLALLVENRKCIMSYLSKKD